MPLLPRWQNKQKKGLSLIGISDHDPATAGSGTVSYFRSLGNLMILNRCKHYQYPVLLSSGTGHVGDFTYAWELIKAAGFPEELVLNCSPFDVI